MNSVIFSIFMLLLTRRKVTRKFLSEKYEISIRTVSRYVDVLLESGIPVISSTGKDGGYMLPDDYKLERTFFSDIEKQRIIDCMNLTKTNFTDRLNRYICEKIDTMGQIDKSSLHKSFENNNLIIDAGPWGSPHLYTNKLEVIDKAIDDRKTLTLKYTDRFESYSERQVDPYNLIFKQGVWYLFAWCHTRLDFRLFKLSRIRYMVVTDKTFVFRDDANVYEKLSGQFDAASEVDIIIEFSSLILTQIEEWLGVDAVYEEGIAYRAAATVYGGNDLVSKILSFGSSIKVLSPSQLKEEVLIECKRILENT